MEIKGIDEKDNHIISLLRENGRMSYSDIGAEVGLSRVAVATRVKVLEEKGIIRGYTAVIDPHAAPEMMTYVVNFDIEPEHFDEVKALLNEQKEKGVAVIFVGEDLDVLLELCDRIMVIGSGCVTGIVDARTATKEEIGLLMTKSAHDAGEEE